MKEYFLCKECGDFLTVEGKDAEVECLLEAISEGYVFGCPGCWKPDCLVSMTEKEFQEYRDKPQLKCIYRTYDPRLCWLTLAYGRVLDASIGTLQGKTVVEAWESRSSEGPMFTLIFTGGVLVQILGGEISLFGRCGEKSAKG